MTSPPSFGPNLRAMRLGFHWSKKHGAFIRMVTLTGTDSLLEFAPADNIPTKRPRLKGADDKHRCWWDSPEILDLLPWLTRIVRVKKYFAVVVNDDGDIARRF